MNVEILQIIVGGLLGGGLIGFIEFLIRRKDEKENSHKDILDAINGLDEKLEVRFDILDKKIATVEEKGDKRNAVNSRVRILRFADEMMEERRHSKDAWEQVLSDCDEYEKYCKHCEENKIDFRNNITTATIEYIKKSYKERLEKNDFL